jgi:TRAP-type C4-dicarboxylate transport system substrate-binding protein
MCIRDSYSITANFAAEAWDDTIPLTFHCTANPTASVWVYVYQPWIWAVQNATGPDGGKFEFTVTFGESPYTPEDSLTALSENWVDVGQLSTDTFNLGAVGYLPFIFSMESGAYVTHFIYEEDWDALGELDDVHMLISSGLQPAQWWGNVQVTELADLAGLDVRAEGAEVPIVEALGANANEIGTADLYSSLDTGLVDGCFFTYSGGAFWLQLWQVADYISQVNLVLPRYMLAMNNDVYESLHPDAKALLDSYCTVDDSVQYAKDHEAAQGGAKGFLAGKGLSPTVLSSEEIANWKAECQPVFDEFVTNLDTLGFDGQGILDRVEELVAEYEAS